MSFHGRYHQEDEEDEEDYDAEQQPLVARNNAKSVFTTVSIPGEGQHKRLGGYRGTEYDSPAPGQQLLEAVEQQVRTSAIVTRQATGFPHPLSSPPQPHSISANACSTANGRGMRCGDGGGSNDASPDSSPLPAEGRPLLRQSRSVRHAIQSATQAMRSWLQVSSTGEVREVQLERQRIQETLGVQLRDFRILDPTLAAGYPSCILCRDHAIVVNLLHIKVIITSSCVLMRHAEMDRMSGFIDELQKRVSGDFLSIPLQVKGTAWSRPSPPDVAVAAAVAATAASSAKSANFTIPLTALEVGLSAPAPASLQGLIPGLAFELKALEVCLEQVISLLAMQTTEVEAAAQVAMEHLTIKVNAANLERVRRIKSHANNLTDDVVTVRSILDKLLDSEKDMRAVALTAREQLQPHQHHQHSKDEQRPKHSPLPGHTASDTMHFNNGYSAAAAAAAAGSNFNTDYAASMCGTVLDEDDNVTVVEMLLEAYTLQLAGTLRRLATLREFIMDTESLINLELDQQRNNLIAVDLAMAFGNIVLSSLAVLVGLYGTNTISGAEESHPAFVVQAVICGALTFSIWSLIVLVAGAKGLQASWFF